MGMISIKHFEQKFSEHTLRQGFKLFDEGRVELLEHPQRDRYKFHIGRNILTLKKTREKVSEVKCGCKRQNCEHLVASLFYFQPPSAELMSVGGTKRQQISTAKESQQLRDILDQINQRVKSFLSHNTVSEEKMVMLLNLLKEHKRQLIKTRRYYFNLGMMTLFSKILEHRLLGDERPLLAFFSATQSELNESYDKGLTEEEKTNWIHATLLSVRTNKAMLSGTYRFLVPRALVIMKRRSQLLMLEDLLNRKKMKDRDIINDILICKIQTGEFTGHVHEGGGAEIPLAIAELNFIRKKNRFALKVLTAAFEKIKISHPHQYLSFLERVLIISQKYNDTHLELKALKQYFLHQYFISDELLQRYHVLSGERAETLKSLALEIEQNERYYSFDKLMLVLKKAGLTREIIRLLNKEKNKFRLVHEHMSSKIAEVSKADLTLYARHLAEAIVDSRYFQLQQNLFAQAIQFLSKLSSENAEVLLTKVLDKLGHQSLIAKHIVNEMRELKLDLT